MLKSLMGDQFDNIYASTIGIDFEIKPLLLPNGRVVHAQIWDTAGQERFRTVTTSYYRSGDAIVLAFDTTEASTFKSLDIWYGDVQAYARPDIDMVLVGTKSDCEDRRQVSADAAEAWAAARGMSYVETSARTSLNVERVFTHLTSRALERLDALGVTRTAGGPDSFSGAAAPLDLSDGATSANAPSRGTGCC